MSARPITPSLADVRRLVLDLLACARHTDVETLTVETAITGRLVRIEIVRAKTEVGDEPPVPDEHVTVKAGTKSRMATIVAAPAEWIEATA